MMARRRDSLLVADWKVYGRTPTDGFETYDDALAYAVRLCAENVYDACIMCAAGLIVHVD